MAGCERFHEESERGGTNARIRAACPLAASLEEIVLLDFDGYNHEARNMSLLDVMLNSARPMGHAFVLKPMLEYEACVTPADLLKAHHAPQTATQLTLF